LTKNIDTGIRYRLHTASIG